MKGLGIVQGWIFEFGGVLYDGTAWRRWLLQLLSKRGLHTHYQVFFRLWDLEYAPRVQSGNWTFQEAIERMLVEAGMSATHINEIIPALRSKRKSLSTEERLLPGVCNTLKLLAASGYQLALSADSDCDHEKLGDKLTRLGLVSYFDFVVAAQERGRRRPLARLYASAISAMRLPKEQVVFVGHEAEHLSVAHSLGLQTVSVACPRADVANWHVQRVSELGVLLQTLPSSRRAG
jgi:FMN phosphatase YigB (HAD superfamily)